MIDSDNHDCELIWFFLLFSLPFTVASPLLFPVPFPFSFSCCFSPSFLPFFPCHFPPSFFLFFPCYFSPSFFLFFLFFLLLPFLTHVRYIKYRPGKYELPTAISTVEQRLPGLRCFERTTERFIEVNMAWSGWSK